jgi:hypothetical protein
VIDAPPRDLRIALQCRTWGCLPSDLQEQEFGIMDRITYASNIYDVFRAANAARNDNWAKWQRDNPEAFELFETVSRMRHDPD